MYEFGVSFSSRGKPYGKPLMLPVFMTPLVDDRVNGLYVKAEDNNDLQNHKTPLSIFLFSESGRVGERYHSLITFQLYNHQFMSDNRTVFTYRHGMSNYSGVAKNGHLIFLRLVGGEWCLANHLRANQSARAKSTIHLPSIY